MKVAIVFHSSCGSTYLVAREYKNALQDLNITSKMFRVEDEKGSLLPEYLTNAKNFKSEFESIEIISSGEELLEYDVIFMGSPTYYGNVSGQMKMFMDSFTDVWINAPFKGTYFGSFVTTASVYGGGEFALQALNIFAKHMGMTVLSVPCNIGCNQPAYGMIHVGGPESNIKPSEELKLGIKNYLNNLDIFNK